MPKKIGACSTNIFVIVALVVAIVSSATAEEFYKDKTIRLVVGFSAGGGFDAYTRLIARHIGKHIPGNPSTTVENMPGAASLIAANYVYNRAKPDGTTIGNFHGNQIMNQVLGQRGVEFDARRFEWLGVPVGENTVCVLSKASGIGSFEKWMAARIQVKLGGQAPGDTTYNAAKILKEALGLPVQLVAGYKGTADIKLAVESGELAGSCSQWESFKVTWRQNLDAGTVFVAVQATPKSHPDLHNVPLAIDFAKTEEARQLIRAGIYDPSAMTRPYALPPGTPN